MPLSVYIHCSHDLYLMRLRRIQQDRCNQLGTDGQAGARGSYSSNQLRDGSQVRLTCSAGGLTAVLTPAVPV